MSAEQCTGTASSYARKYALNGLFLIDETEADADSQKPATPTTEVKKPWLNKDSKQFTEAVTYIKNGGHISKIEEKYNLSAEVKTLLEAKN
jgi:hypothetical protein